MIFNTRRYPFEVNYRTIYSIYAIDFLN